MKAEFFLKSVEREDGTGKHIIVPDVEHVSVDVEGHGKQVVVREATDKDRHQFKSEYAAFKKPPPSAAEPAKAKPARRRR